MGPIGGQAIDTIDPRPAPWYRPDLKYRLDRKRLTVLLSAAGAALLLFLLFAWPTLYRHPDGSDRFRVNRLTGKAQVYDRRSEEWRPAKRGRRNASGTSSGGRRAESRGEGSRGGGGSPIGGGGSYEGRPADPASRSEGWWYDDGSAKAKRRKSAQEDQWWYQDEGGGRRSESRSGGSPIGGSRESGGGGGSPIGGSDRGGPAKEKARDEAEESKSDGFWED